MGANVEEGMVGEWRKREGDAMKKGDQIVELVTDKATFDLESEVDGALIKILAEEKSSVPVNYILAVAGDDDPRAIESARQENEKLLADHRSRANLWNNSPAGGGVSQPDKPKRSKARATPAARRLARKSGVELEDVQPASGAVITEDDIRKYLESGDTA